MYKGKRLLDLTLVLLAAPVWVPVMAVTAVLVWLRMGRPILFGQERAGLNGHPFRLLKFRTMLNRRGADGALLPDGERLTPFGMRLRAWSLDEIPGLLNVLRGELSLVGPRPLPTHYLPRYSERHWRRHEVRPGVTGLAQVQGRNALSWPEKFELDLQYVERNSLALDLQILARTAVAVLLRTGISSAGEATMPEFTGYGQPPEPGARAELK